MAAVDAMTRVELKHRATLDAMKGLLHAADESGRKDKVKFAQYKSRYAAELLLIEQREVVEHLQHQGLLDDLDAEPLVHKFNKRIEARLRTATLDGAATRPLSRNHRGGACQAHACRLPSCLI